MRTLRAIGWSIFSSIFIFGASISMAQGPWNFNGSADGWVKFNNASTLTAGDSAVDWNVTGQWNQMRLSNPGISYDGSNKYLAITLKNTTTNNYMVVGIQDNVGTNWTYIRNNSSVIDTSMSAYSTYYVDLTNGGASGTNWTAGNDISNIFLRARIGSSGNSFGTGNIYVDKIELLNDIPSNPTITITSTTSGVTDGSTTSDSSINLTFTSSEATSDFVEGLSLIHI